MAEDYKHEQDRDIGPDRENHSNQTYAKGDSKSVELPSIQFPVQEDCASDAVPKGTVNMEGKKKILIPELITMNKVLFERYRLDMYSYLNQSLKWGRLSSVIGRRVTTRRITHEQCNFTGVTFWRIDRENFYADVAVELSLSTDLGPLNWKGYLVCFCGFDEDLFCDIEELTASVDEKNRGLDKLSPYLIPYATNKRVDQICESILDTYQNDALADPRARNAAKLAASMGLKIEYHPVYEHRGVRSIIFFKDQPLEIGEDRIEKGEDGKKMHIKAPKGQRIMVGANTIVMNTNRINRSYPECDISHECYHFREHYLFFRLQEMDSNDLRQVKVHEVIVDKEYEQKDPIYFMEKQANRGALGLIMPATDTRQRIMDLRREPMQYNHAGELYQYVGKKLAKTLHQPYFRIRTRMIQLGYIEAKGALNYVQREEIRPFAFDSDSWRCDQHTFVVEEAIVNGIRKSNSDLDELMRSGKYIYADGHVVRNDPKYVQTEDDMNTHGRKRILTPWAEAHVDGCCLRFTRQYVQVNVGRYVYGRMYSDTDYIKQTEFFLADLINDRQMDVLDAKPEYKRTFPRNFGDALKKLRKQRNISQEKIAEMLCMDDSTFKRWVQDPGKYRNEDFLTMLCLILELPDWISDLLFKRAGVQLDDDDRRQSALHEILRARSADGIAAANDYLKGRNLRPLTLC